MIPSRFNVLHILSKLLLPELLHSSLLSMTIAHIFWERLCLYRLVGLPGGKLPIKHEYSIQWTAELQ
jgi:hypothetical protein